MVKQVVMNGDRGGLGNEDDRWWDWILKNEDSYRNSTEENLSDLTHENDLLVINWDLAQSIFERDVIVDLIVYGFNQGGLLAKNDEIQGFIPVSHLIHQPVGMNFEEKKDVFSKYLGKTISLKIIECVREEQRIVLSERAALTGNGIRKSLVSSLRVGQVVAGKVTNVTNFGVFIDLGGVEGLAHVSELSWGRVIDPGDFAKVGDKISAIVLQVDQPNARIALSIKRLLPNPWEMIQSRHKVGDVIDARVSSIARYGIFLRLDEGIEGLIHVSSLKNIKDRKGLTSRFKINQMQRVQIVHIDAEHKRLGLRLEEDG